MEEIKVAPAAYVAPAAPPANKERYIQKTPLWVVIMRGLQIFFGFVIVCMCGYLIHGKALDANVFALVVVLMTWVVALYALITEKVPSANGAYNIWAVLSLDLFMAIMWLASMGANAALRASFKYDVDVEYCYNDGSAVNSNHCVLAKRELEKRAAVAGTVGLAVMSAVAGLSALMLLFFIATLVFHGRTFHTYHQAKKASTPDNATVEMNNQQPPPLTQQPTGGPYGQYPQQAQGQGYPMQSAYQQTVSPVSPPQTQAQVYNPGYPQQQGYPQPQTYPQAYPQTVPSPAPVSTPSPAPHEMAPHPVPTPSPAAYELPQGQPQAGPYQLPGSPPPGQQPGPYQLPGSPAPGQAGPYQLPGSQTQGYPAYPEQQYQQPQQGYGQAPAQGYYQQQ